LILAARKWTIDPFYLSRHNPNSNLVTNTRMLAKFVRRKDSALLIDFAVSAVHTKVGVPVRVDPPVIKIDLKKY
jgi:hypothetical protein